MKARTIIIILVVIAVLGVGGYFIWQQQQNTAKAATTRQTATVTRGALAATVSGAGNLYAPQQTNLNFQLTGVPITKVNVQVGDKVKAGDLLAQVDDSDLQFSLRTAQSNLKSAQAKLTQTKTPASKDDVATAQAQVDSAQAAYDAAVIKYGHTNDQITVAKAALEKATITLQQAQAAYNLVAWRPDVGMSSQATTLQQATIDYQSALANYNLTLTGINDTSVKSAVQSLASANANLTKLIAPPTQQDLDIAQASVDNAQVAVDQAKRKLDQARIVRARVLELADDQPREVEDLVERGPARKRIQLGHIRLDPLGGEPFSYSLPESLIHAPGFVAGRSVSPDCGASRQFIAPEPCRGCHPARS